MSRLFISAARKSSGKTTVSLGLCAALRGRGHAVQPFKKGPDFIDPLWLTAAAGKPCRNLDRHLMSEQEILSLYGEHAHSADICVIEGNKGLFDGLSNDGHDSSAALARLLAAPVVLVIDAEGITRGIAPLVIGYRAFERDVGIAGVILNKVANSRHETKLRSAIESYTDLPVLGAIHRSPDIQISERHLGLIPANEASESQAQIATIAAAIDAQVDIDRLIAIARAAPAARVMPRPIPSSVPGPRLRVGVAQDAAFGFYYHDDLESLSAHGFDPIFFDTLKDRRLPPKLDGLFIGGGFPETHMDGIQANFELRAEIRAAVASGLPVYAECGGLMYLSRSISWQGRRCAMVGAIEADAVMHGRPKGKGYVMLEETEHAPWPAAGARGPIAAHEFHFAALENLPGNARFAYRMLRGEGITGRHDGIVTANTLASFSHRRGVGLDPWPARFAAFMRRCAAERDAPVPIMPSAAKAESRRSLGHSPLRRATEMPLFSGEPF
ncbi:MAG: cobyrinate a,c-diamide synthase [Xanthobacteraceae bacterium]